MTEPTTDEQMDYLKRWAADQRCVFEWEGEVGFGRECVGITRGSKYVDLGPPRTEEYGGQRFTFPEPLREASSYEVAPDAYHKHDCLCVLGRGPEAIRQLYDWVKKIEAAGLIVTDSDRNPSDPIDLVLHGISTPHLAYATAPAQPQ